MDSRAPGPGTRAASPTLVEDTSAPVAGSLKLQEEKVPQGARLEELEPLPLLLAV